MHDSVMSVRELRLVVTVDDHEQALRFYRDVLGLPQLDDFSSDEGKVILLDAGRATIEVVDRRQAEFIDRVEVGRRVAGHIRVALEVDDAADRRRESRRGRGDGARRTGPHAVELAERPPHRAGRPAADPVRRTRMNNIDICPCRS